MFEHYSAVDAEMLKRREIVLVHKLPRRLELQVGLRERVHRAICCDGDTKT
jgi:hypothetical protein